MKESQKLKHDRKRIQYLEQELSIQKDKVTAQGRELEQHKEFQEQANTVAKRLHELEEAVAVTTYAVVLVDGDGYPFPDHLIRKGLEGGQEAAQHLESRTIDYLKGHYNGSQWRIIVRIFIGLDGLYGVYQRMELVNHLNVLRQFMIGFGKARGLFDVVDVGRGKERADHKLKGTCLSTQIRDIPCVLVLRLM